MAAISLTDWTLATTPRFVGLDNYASMLSDRRFLQSVGVTLRYTLLSLPILLVLGLGLSLLLNRPVRGIGLFRTIMFVPSVISGVAVAVLWLQILNPEFGILNQLLRSLGIENPPRWLTNPDWAVPAVVLTSVWTVGGARDHLPRRPAEHPRPALRGGRDRRRRSTPEVPPHHPADALADALLPVHHDADRVLPGLRRGLRPRRQSRLERVAPVLSAEPLERGLPQRRIGYASALGLVFVLVGHGRDPDRDASLGAVRLLRSRRASRPWQRSRPEPAPEPHSLARAGPPRRRPSRC